ncbi:MAG: TetR/AcrR family transcriptional regulator [Actinomycetota bacterium]|nr:TetR/AcrR family transcriptional regulator [Actinomycetota bacterium]
MSWAERAADRSPVVQRSRTKGVEQARAIVRAAQRLIALKGASFTTQELVKEAGIALQTFYRYFQGKDQLLIAVIEDMVDSSAAQYKQQATAIEDPLERIRFHISVVMESLAEAGDTPHGPRFITAEHWRLSSLYPEEMERATRPFKDLLQDEIEAARAEGLIEADDPAYDAWLVNQLVMSVFHHYAFAPADHSYKDIADRLWSFCLAGFSAHPDRGGERLVRAKKRRAG